MSSLQRSADTGIELTTAVVIQLHVADLEPHLQHINAVCMSPICFNETGSETQRCYCWEQGGWIIYQLNAKTHCILGRAKTSGTLVVASGIEYGELSFLLFFVCECSNAMTNSWEAKGTGRNALVSSIHRKLREIEYRRECYAKCTAFEPHTQLQRGLCLPGA